jgi:hypothetical protein
MALLPRAGSIVDQAAVAQIPAANPQNLETFGTVWPLLANRIYRIYNASALIQAGDTNFGCQVTSLYVAINWLDQSNNAVGEPLVLAAWASGVVPLGPGGLGISANGDPIIAFRSNFLLTNNAAGVPGALQIYASADMATVDGTTAISLIVSMVFDDIAA